MKRTKKRLTTGLVFCVILSMLIMTSAVSFASSGNDNANENLQEQTEMSPSDDTEKKSSSGPAESDGNDNDNGRSDQNENEKNTSGADATATGGRSFTAQSESTVTVSSYDEFNSAVENASGELTVILNADIVFPSGYYYINKGSRITVKSDGQTKHTLDLSACYGIVARTNMVFENVRIANSKYYAIYADTAGTEVTIRKSVVSGGSIGIYATGIKKLAVTDSEISGAGGHGIYGNGAATEIEVAGTTVSGCTYNGIYVNGIKTLTVTESVISGCGKTEENTSGGGIFSNGSSVYLSAASINNNKAGNCGGGVEILKGSLTAENCTISGNTSKYGGGIHSGESSLTIKKTEIKNNRASTDGGGLYSNMGSLVIDGDAVISGNTSGYSGGGIFCGNGCEAAIKAKVSGNTASSGGGGISVKSSAEAVLSAAEVTGNTSVNSYGGGILISGGNVTLKDKSLINSNTAKGNGGGASLTSGSFTMQNSSITNNRAVIYNDNPSSGYGGGIYCADKNKGMKLVSGMLSGNSAERNGGGMYIHTGATAEIDDAVIYRNTALNQGGGVWACPMSDTEVYVNEGMAVFGNTASGDAEYGSAGDDLVVQLTEETTGVDKALLSRRMLGGFENHYYKDGELSHDPAVVKRYKGVWEVDVNVPRYRPGDQEPDASELYDKTFKSGEDSVVLKNNVSEEAQKWAMEEATLFITGNTAVLRGGGIATNGSLTMGEKTTLRTVSVTKKWKGDPETSCTISLHQYDKEGNDEVLETVELTAENGWQHTFTELPVTYAHKEKGGKVVHKKYTYGISEAKMSGWTANIKKAGTDKWIITNTRIGSSVKTGDESMLALYAAVAAAALLGLALFVVKRRSGR